MLDIDALAERLVSYANAVVESGDWPEQKDAILAAYIDVGGDDSNFQDALTDYGLSGIGAWTASDLNKVDELQAKIIQMFKAARKEADQ